MFERLPLAKFGNRVPQLSFEVVRAANDLENLITAVAIIPGATEFGYLDAAGVWTIGYGHTSAAGAPHVRSGMKITRKEGERILGRDIAIFASGVQSLLARPLSESQFSALVSFAYNVGLENFRKSSVLRAVNAGDFAAVPRRLSLWVKCRGRVLSGLVRRRAAEAAMFIEAAPRAPRARYKVPVEDFGATIEPVPGKSLQRSSTGFAAVVSALAGAASSPRRRARRSRRCGKWSRRGARRRRRHNRGSALDHQGTPPQGA